MGLKLKALTKSPWVYHLSTGSCNNCDIEILDCLTPRYDLERFGIVLVGSPRHADVLLVTGNMTMKNIPRVRQLYEQMPKPGLVVAVGTCAMGHGVFDGSYVMPHAVDEILPVDVYVPGCPPKPEALIAGVAKLLNKIRQTA
jgi:membrane-bound hydrogenase subunit mbhJ